MPALQAPSPDVVITGLPPGVMAVVIGFIAMIVLSVMGFPLVRALGRRLERGKPAKQSALGNPEVESLRRSVDRLSVEVERVAEGQRWMLREAGEASEAPNGSDAN